MAHNFVESTIPLRAIKTAVELQHSHPNKPLLDSLTTDGSSIQFLAGDGQYRDVPETFFVEPFLLKYDQDAGNVTAHVDSDGKLYLQSTPTFAHALGDKVIGSIEVESANAKQLNVSIAEVNTVSGDISENDIKYVTVGSGLQVSFANGIISFSIVNTEAPFTNFMQKQPTVQQGIVGIFDANGQIVGGGVLLSALVTTTQLNQHISNTNLHVTAELQAQWSAKQNALTDPQLLAVNSGITSVKVQGYDKLASEKQSIAGNTPNMNVVTDANGNITTEAKFDPATKISVVPTAVENRVAVFNSSGGVKDSGIVLGAFTSGQTVKDYIDAQINANISGSSYQGTFTYFGTQAEVESVSGAVDGNTAIVYEGTLTDLEGILKGTYNGTAWTFAPVSPAPVSGAWFETDHLLTNDPVVPGRVIVRMDGVNNPALDVRPNTSFQLDDTTISLNSAGAVGFKMQTLESGKQVLNATTSDNIAYEFSANPRTVKEVLDDHEQKFEPKFAKNTAFNKNFDTTSGGAASTSVVGNEDTRLTNARPASDVYAWAKAATKPTYTYAEVGALGATQTAVAAAKLETSRTIRVALDSNEAVDFDGTANITPGVWGTLPVARGGTGATNLTDGYALIGAGGGAVNFRAITSAPTSGSTSLFTAGGAYTLSQAKQNKISVQSAAPSGVNGDLWFQTSGSMITIRYYNGSSWGTYYPTIDPTWKAKVDALLESAGQPYVCTVGGTAIAGIPQLSWIGSAGNYTCTIPYSTHNKGKITGSGGQTYYVPRIVTYSYVSTNNVEITYDSPAVNYTTGGITLYSNINTLLLVMIY